MRTIGKVISAIVGIAIGIAAVYVIIEVAFSHSRLYFSPVGYED